MPASRLAAELAADLRFRIGLWATSRKSARWPHQHRVVVYLAYDRDWSDRQLTRNGHYGPPLVWTWATERAARFRAEGTRSRSLVYSGRRPADAAGLEEDLRVLGFADATVAAFLAAAAPHWEAAY